MNLCSHNHEEICFEGRQCPLCASMKESEEGASVLKDEISDLKNKVKKLEEELQHYWDEPLAPAIEHATKNP